MRASPFIAFDGLPADATQTSLSYHCKYMDKIAGQVVIAGGTSIVGNLIINVSDDFGPENFSNYFTPTNWSLLDGGTISVAGNGVLNIPVLPINAMYVQFVWTPSAGTGGTIKATLKLEGRQ